MNQVFIGKNRSLFPINPVVFLTLLIISLVSAGLWAQALPPDIQADQYLLAAKKQLEAENYVGAAEYFEKILALGVKVPAEFYYHYGKTLLKTQKYEASKSALTKYVTQEGRAGKYYTQALELLTEADEKASVNKVRVSKSIQGEILVQGGTFLMGSETGDSDEKPVHSVTVSGFWIIKTEVTQKDYAALMGTNPSKFRGDTLPVETVSWYDAVAYANKLSQKDGLRPAYRINGTSVEWDRSADGWRLPTEAEWEYAARGGASSRGYTYAGGNDLGSVGWYRDNSGGKTQPVGKKVPNELGLYDLSGNVWEWCWDWNGSYIIGSQTDPTGAASGTYRVNRGGCWSSGTSYLRSADRNGNTPDRRLYALGFRLVRPLVH